MASSGIPQTDCLQYSMATLIMLLPHGSKLQFNWSESSSHAGPLREVPVGTRSACGSDSSFSVVEYEEVPACGNVVLSLLQGNVWR